MAGLNFVYGKSCSIEPFKQAAEDCTEKVKGYNSSIIFNNNVLTIFDISYDEYPIKKIETDSFVVLIEGHIYDEDNYAKVAKFIDENINEQTICPITKWLGDKDGDFNIYHISKQDKNLNIISDALNRIPIFYPTTDGTPTIGGRSIHFIKKAFDKTQRELSLDREAIAQTLLLRNPFRRKTLYNEISETGPGAFLKVDEEGLIYSQIYQIQFDKRKHKDRTIEKNARELANILQETCEYRGQLDGEHVVSLSGGKDSRLIATTLVKSGIDISAASFYDDTTWAKKDVNVAKEIVEELQIDWQLHYATRTGSNMRELLYRKGGMNNFALGNLIDFNKKVSDNREIQMYTGDVGDLFDGGWSVYRSFNSTIEAAKWIIEKNAEIPPQQVSDLTGLSEEELTAFVVNRLDELPETEIRAKVEHFFTRERGMNLDFHGEDRTRSFFWTHAPLNSRPVLEYLITLPREQKKDYKLYKQLMREIRDELYDVDYVPYGAPVGSKKQLLVEKLYGFASDVSVIEHLVKSVLFDRSEYPEPVSELLKAQVDNTNELEKYLDCDELRAVAARTDTIAPNTAFDLITITTLAEYIHNNELTIDSYQTEKFR